MFFCKLRFRFLIYFVISVFRRRRSFLVCDKAGYALHCPSCALTISLVQDPIVGTAITSAEYKQLLARSYDRYLSGFMQFVLYYFLIDGKLCY